MALQNLSPKLKARNAESINFQFIVSKAFSKSIESIIPGVLEISLNRMTSSICRILYPYRPLMYPV